MNSLFSNDSFELLETETNTIAIRVTKPSFPIQEFEEVLSLHPRIQLTRVMNLRCALADGTDTPVEIGILRPLFELKVSQDEEEALVTLHETKENLLKRYDEIVHAIVSELGQTGVTNGILSDVLTQQLDVGRPIVIARGTTPVHGEPAKVQYYAPPSRQPAVRKDGRVDVYEVHFVDEVKKGDWLGEKEPATEGVPGVTVTGKTIRAQKGANVDLLFDKKTVETTTESDGTTVLRARVNGVVTFRAGNIAVDEALVIEGDVGSKTGNIQHDGAVIVHGTIQEGFHVKATKDVSINGPMGVHLVDIESTHGDIFIKGGVSQSTVKAERGTVFTKYANESTIAARDTIHIGIYALGGQLNANQIVVQSDKGQVIGSIVQASQCQQSFHGE